MSKIAIVPVSTLPVIEHNGQRVITLSMMDQVHGRPDGTARRNFNTHKAKLVESRHYFKMSADEFRSRFPGVISDRATEDVSILSERGYLVLVKSFTDDLAWQVQEQLVDGYFRAGSLTQLSPGSPLVQAITLEVARMLVANAPDLMLSLSHGGAAKGRTSLRNGLTTGQVLQSWGLRSVPGLVVAFSNRLVRAGCYIGTAEMGKSKAKFFDPDLVHETRSILRPWCEKFIQEKSGQRNLFSLKKAV